MSDQIAYMHITNVEMEDDDWKSFGVYYEDLEVRYPDRYRNDFNDDEFFDLALEYIENYIDDVVSTDYAKLDYFQ
jgi:hypothetical protein